VIKKLLIVALALIVVIALGLVITVRVLLGPERVRSAVEAQATAALGMPVKVGSASARIWPRPGLTLGDVVVGQPAEMTLRRADVSTGLRPLLSRRVEDAEVVIEDSRLDLPKLLAALDALGRTQAATPPAPPSSASVTIVNVKTIALRGVELVAGDRRAMVTFESALTGDRLDISKLTAQAEQSNVHASGAIESLERRIVRLTIDAERLDLDGFLQFATALSAGMSGVAARGAPTPSRGPAPATANAPPLDLRAAIRAARGSLLGVAFSNLESSVAITSSDVKLAPLKFGAFNGRVTGEIAVRLTGAQPELTLTEQFDGIDLQQVAAFAGQASAVTGTLTGRVRVTGRGLDQATMLRTATGTGEVALSNGRLPGLQLVRPLVLAFGRPAQMAPPEGSGEQFTRISATLAIDREQLRTNNLQFASRDVDMTGTGLLGLAPGSGGMLDVRADLRLSEELSAQAGRDLIRYTREGNRIVLPATITGTVAAPRVWINQEQALKRAIKNEVEERVRGLFERMRRKTP
jgi:uncharacterized protein involved in outer membrane biogenesis